MRWPAKYALSVFCVLGIPLMLLSLVATNPGIWFENSLEFSLAIGITLFLCFACLDLIFRRR